MNIIDVSLDVIDVSLNVIDVSLDIIDVSLNIIDVSLNIILGTKLLYKLSGLSVRSSKAFHRFLEHYLLSRGVFLDH